VGLRASLEQGRARRLGRVEAHGPPCGRGDIREEFVDGIDAAETQSIPYLLPVRTIDFSLRNTDVYLLRSLRMGASTPLNRRRWGPQIAL